MVYAIFSLTILLFWSCTSVIGHTIDPTSDRPNIETQSRSEDTCADPSLTVTFMQAFNAASVGFALGTEAEYVGGITSSPTAGFLYQGKVFRGWANPDPQNFTSAFYRLFDSATGDWIFELATTDGNPPSVAGFVPGGIVGYLYATQVCGSVPLLIASNEAAGAHFYTTEVNDHAQLISTAGWADAGIAAYVLPLSAD